MSTSTAPTNASDLPAFSMTADRGFLPVRDPLTALPAELSVWDGLASSLPKLLMTDQAREVLDDLPPLDSRMLKSPAELERAMLVLSYIGHAYVWGVHPPPRALPAGIAVPWHAIAMRLGRPPVLSYASYALHNWRRLDPSRPVELGNIALLQNFLGGQDEEWFVLVHQDIEQKAAPALARIGAAQQAAAASRVDELTAHLRAVATAMEAAYATLLRMPERCDPYVYFHRVRPYLYGWKDQPALPDGLVYEGVAAYADKPQKFRGETGAQSGIIPALDALLGITHEDGPLKTYLLEMLDYMPPAHRAFIDAIWAGPSVREFVLASGDRALQDAYNACIDVVHRFRGKHLEYAATYIHQQARRDAENPTDVGTGGTPFMPYLKKHRDETEKFVVG